MSPIRRMRGWLERLLPLGAFLTLAAFGLAGYTFVVTRQQTVDRSARVCGVLRALLADALQQTEASPMPAEQKRVAEAFYRRYIAALNQLPCENPAKPRRPAG